MWRGVGPRKFSSGCAWHKLVSWRCQYPNNELTTFKLLKWEHKIWSRTRSLFGVFTVRTCTYRRQQFSCIILLILPQWQKLEPMKHLDSMSPFAIKFHYSIATALSFVLHAIYLGCLMGVVGWLSYLTTRESLIGHSGWAQPHYTEMGHSSSSFLRHRQSRPGFEPCHRTFAFV